MNSDSFNARLLSSEFALIYFAEDTKLDRSYVDEMGCAEWVDDLCFYYAGDLNNVDLRQCASNPCFESLKVTKISNIEEITLHHTVVITFSEIPKLENLVSHGEHYLLPPNVCIKLSPHAVLFRTSESLSCLIARLVDAEIGSISSVFLVLGILITGHNNARYHLLGEESAAERLAIIAEEQSDNKNDLQLRRTFLSQLRSAIVHSTSDKNFRKIIGDKVIKRGMGSAALGKCQKLGCLSLSDFRRSTEEALLADPCSWLDQILRPWGGRDTAITVTLFLKRDALDHHQLKASQKNKISEPPYGRFIIETEICYGANIRLDCIEKIMFVNVANPTNMEVIPVENLSPHDWLERLERFVDLNQEPE